MAILEIKKYPSPVLRKRAKKIAAITDEILKLTQDMIETLKVAGGVGLAAPQIGSSIRLCIIKPYEEDATLVLLNPKIKSGKGKAMMEEGCLSLPGATFNVNRYDEIIVNAMNMEGKMVELKVKELLSRIIQHEVDHLNGVLIFDRANLLERLKKARSRKFKSVL